MCGDERGRGKEVSGEFVIAGGDAAPIFDAAEEVFDFVPPSIETLGAVGFRPPLLVSRCATGVAPISPRRVSPG